MPLEKVPSQHNMYMKDSCRCIRRLEENDWDDYTFLKVLLVRRVYRNVGGLFFTYHCHACGSAISNLIPHRLVASGTFFDAAELGITSANFSESVIKLLGHSSAVPQSALFLLGNPSTRNSVAPHEDTQSQKVDSRYFFVDEAGDLNFFGRRGKSLLGSHGVSNTFIVGMCYIENLPEAEQAISDLRADLLSRPSLKCKPSMQPDAGKTAIAFHACKDLPQVREEVYKLISQLDIKAIAAVRRKRYIEEHLRKSGERLGRHFENKLYDQLVEQVFHGLLHKADNNHIDFAKRGTTSRQGALKKALTSTHARFSKKYPHAGVANTHLRSLVPSQSAGIQIVDYLLWSLQRLYEKADDSAWKLTQDKFSLVKDLDDKRNKPYGEWYSKKNSLDLSKIEKTS